MTENIERPGPEAEEPGDAKVPTADDIAVRTRGLTKRFGAKVALDSLDLDIRKGDIFGYIGPNGAGKTTTIRILAALLTPSEGTATVHGVDVTKSPNLIKELVGYMPDAFGVYDNMTLKEYLEFFAAAYKIPYRSRKDVLSDVLELTDLTAKQNDLVNAFSRGMKQRACLAKTLLHDPKVLILDEPASGLDPRARIELRELLKELQRMGKTILVSSHILTELSTICNTIGIIETGTLITAGDVDQILKSLRSNRRFTVKLLEKNDTERAVKWLETRSVIEKVSSDEGVLNLEIDGDDTEIAEIAEGLFREGLRFVVFQEEMEDLESAFMALTRGEVA